MGMFTRRQAPLPAGRPGTYAAECFDFAAEAADAARTLGTAARQQRAAATTAVRSAYDDHADIEADLARLRREMAGHR